MLRRKVEDRMLEWRRTKGGQGLLVTGARQVGKTSSIERFAAEHYASVLKIDFVERPEAVEVISGATSLADLTTRVTALARSPLPEGKTLLFFDEVQRCGDAITWMRYLAQDERFDVVYSGSMLGVEVFDYRSLPVGTLDVVEMFPLDFEEFTWAFGVDPSLWDVVRECHGAGREVPGFLHDLLMGLYRRYVLVGGMPEAVKTFADTSDTQAMRARQRSILDAYRADIARYVGSPEWAQTVKTIYDAVPAQLNKENRRFFISGLDKDARFRSMRPGFDWLNNAGVTIPVDRATEAVFPLGLSREGSFFKLYLNDVGLLFSTFPPADVEAIIAASDALNLGCAFENAVAQELRAQGRRRLYYFNSNKVGEVDFLVEDRRLPKVIPVEVKSGRGSGRHAALDSLMGVANYGLEEAVVLHQLNLRREGRCLYLPLYMAGLL